MNEGLVIPRKFSRNLCQWWWFAKVFFYERFPIYGNWVVLYFETTAKAAKHTHSLDHTKAYNHVYPLLQQKNNFKQLTVQLHLNLTKHTCSMYVLDMTHFLISITYIHTCAWKTSDVETVVQSICVCATQGVCVHNNLHEHECMSVMYMPNLVHMHVDFYINCKPRMTV